MMTVFGNGLGMGVNLALLLPTTQHIARGERKIASSAKLGLRKAAVVALAINDRAALIRYPVESLLEPLHHGRPVRRCEGFQRHPVALMGQRVSGFELRGVVRRAPCVPAVVIG